MEHISLSNNNITIYSYPNEHLHSFCIALYVKAGCLYEAEDENGITHFLEHIAFRSVDAQMNRTLYHTLDCCGLSFNASTYKEFVQFTISGSPSRFQTAAEIITRILHTPVLTKEDVDLERQRIKAEIREYDEKSTLDYFTDCIIWKETSLARTITGKRNTLDKISRNRLIQAHRQTFTQENIFFYLTGAVSDTQTDLLRTLIEAYPIPSSGSFRTCTAPIPSDFFQRNASVFHKKDKNCYVRFSFDVDTCRYTNAELDLLYDILFSGHSSAVYQELSEKRGLIYSHDAGMEQYINLGSLYFSFEVQPQHLNQAVEIMIEKLKALKKGITDELACVKASYTDNSYMLLDNADDLNWHFAYENHILNCGYRNIEDRILAYADVTPERLTEVIREIMQPSNLLLTVKGKEKDVSIPVLESLIKKL